MIRTHYFAVLWICNPSPYHPGHRPLNFGALARIRTADLPLTRRLLWPTELLGHYFDDTLHCTLRVGIGVPPTTYLQCIIKVMLERVTGFEPVSLAWKAKAQPLYHTRNFDGVCSADRQLLLNIMATLRGLEPRSPGRQPSVIPIYHRAKHCILPRSKPTSSVDMLLQLTALLFQTVTHVAMLTLLGGSQCVYFGRETGIRTLGTLRFGSFQDF